MDRQPLLEEHRGSHEDRGRAVRIASPGQRGWLSEQLQQQRSGAGGDRGGGSSFGGVTPTLQESPSDHAGGGGFVSAGYQQAKLQPRPNMVPTRGAPAAASRARCVVVRRWRLSPPPPPLGVRLHRARRPTDCSRSCGGGPECAPPLLER